MCDSMGYALSTREKHRMNTSRFVHRIRPVSHPMPPFPSGITWADVEEAFPLAAEEFHKLTVTLFVREDGYRRMWEDTQSQEGQWYGLSWGCIHYETLFVWSPRARQIRWLRRFWRVRTLLSWLRLCPSPASWSDEEKALCNLAFWDPLPVFAFKQAMGQLIAEGLLSHVIDTTTKPTTHMYYPLPALAHRLEQARKKRQNGSL